VANNREIQQLIDSSKLTTRLSAIGTATALVMLILTIVLWKFRGGDVFHLAVLPYALAMLFSAGAMIYGILGTSAAQEEEEKELLSKRASSRALDVEEDVRFTAGRSFENYRRFAPYALTVIAALITGTILYSVNASMAERTISSMRSDAIHSALISAVMMMISIFAGAFFIGQSRTRNFRWLRPVGAWLVSGFAVMAIATIAAVCHSNNLVRVDYTAARILMWIFAILGAEFISNFVIEFYRPRTLAESRPIFESRFLALFTEPGGVVRNIASALDYQFGFKVSGTWIYAFMEKSFFPVLLIWALMLWASTTVHEIGPSEVGVKEEWGRVVSEKPLTPGIYWSLPYPFGKMKHFSTTEIHQLELGEMNRAKKEAKAGSSDEKNKPSTIVTWTKQHGGDDENYIVAVPDESSRSGSSETASVSFLRLSMALQYRIKADGVMDYAYANNNPEKALLFAGEQVITEYLASCSMQDIMSTRRREAADTIKNRIQQAADQLKLGIEVIAATITNVHPPVGAENLEVAAAFQNIIGSMESKQTNILNAEAYAAKQLPESAAAAAELVAQARSYSYTASKVAAAEAERFNTQLKTFLVMPGMFKLRTYLDFLEADCKDMRKFILASDLGSEVLQFNLEIKERLDLVDTDITKLTYN